MSSITTPVIGLFKPVPGTAEPFRVADLNDNMDLLDAAYGAIEPAVEDATEAAAAASAAAIAANAAAAALDTEAIILAIESDALDVDGGTA